MKIAVAQLNSSDRTEENVQTILNFAKEAWAVGAQAVFFPENSLFFRVSSQQTVEPLTIDSPWLEPLRKFSAEKKILLHLTTPIRDEKGEVTNSSLIIDEKGQVRLIYKKIHLFDIALEGQKPIRESDSFRHGSEAAEFQKDDFKFGSTICYDVRFSELFHRYALQGVDVILVPAAFLVKTGQAHWEPLLRARAIESQCYILAAAQWGQHKSNRFQDVRETYGHSMIIDPWGQILQKLESGTGLIYAELSKEAVARVRQQIPMSQHRRLK